MVLPAFPGDDMTLHDRTPRTFSSSFGWSWRVDPFGGDGFPDREAALLDAERFMASLPDEPEEDFQGWSVSSETLRQWAEEQER